MNESDLRALVREAVARHMGRPQAEPQMSLPSHPPLASGSHPSHALYLTLINSTDACIIEPSVPCEHCGYCKTHGH